MGFQDIIALMQLSDKNLHSTKLITGETEETNFVPFPIAELKLTSKIFDLLQQGLLYKQVKKGINETIKFLDKGKVEVVIMASDADPIEMLAQMPGLCEERSVPYCFVKEAAGLGRACGISRPVICCCIISDENSSLKAQIDGLKDNLEILFYH